MEGLWEKRPNQEFNDFYGEANIDGVVKAQRMKWLGYLIKRDNRRTVNVIYGTEVGGRRRKEDPGACRRTIAPSLNVASWEDKAKHKKKWAY